MSKLRIRCETCAVKIPKRQHILRCDICSELKHLRFQNLTKSDASYIQHLNLSWTCSQCITDILPINAVTKPRCKNNENKSQKFKIKCTSCNGHCYSERNVRVCGWCEGKVHVKCWKEDLGCISCCEQMIPGYHTYYYELFDSLNHKNDLIYNPYSSKHFTMQIGNEFDNEGISNTMWNDVSEFLVSCKYKEPKYVNTPSEHELSIFSLNRYSNFN